MSDSPEGKPESEPDLKQAVQGCLGCLGVIGVLIVGAYTCSVLVETDDTTEPEEEAPEVVQQEEGPEPADPSMTEAEILTVIAEVGFRDREQTIRRFEFLLGAFSQICPSEEGPASIPDRLVSIHQLLEDAGLGDGLLDMANTLHQLTSEISVITGGEHGGCTDFWTAYAILRRDQGLTPERAVESVAGIYRALY